MNYLPTTPDIILAAVALISLVFSAYNYLRNPQQQLDKRQAVEHTDIEGKAQILAQQVQWEKELNEKKFAEFGTRLDASMTLAQNHIHTVDTKVDALVISMNTLSNEVTRLTTIIEERIPRLTA
jgi:hypothetical protein